MIFTTENKQIVSPNFTKVFIQSNSLLYKQLNKLHTATPISISNLMEVDTQKTMEMGNSQAGRSVEDEAVVEVVTGEKDSHVDLTSRQEHEAVIESSRVRREFLESLSDDNRDSDDGSYVDPRSSPDERDANSQGSSECMFLNI